MRRAAFTLIELLVVIAVVGILISLLLPAVQAARDAGRNVECKNKVRQLALAFQMHHDVHSHFAGDGWGLRWVGDPDRGSGRQQPGGWVYRLLPFMEAGEIAQLGSDGNPGQITPEQKQGLAEATQTHLGWFQCPTRRHARLTLLNTQWAYVNMASTELTASISYDANWGDGPVAYKGGPQSPRLDRVARLLGDLPTSNGIVYPLSEVKSTQVTDGLSNTYLVGEVFWWDSGIFDHLEELNGLSSPFSNYFVSSAYDPPLQDLLPGATVDRQYDRWGGQHPATWNIAFCDGSARSMPFDIDLQVHRRLANREDGLTIGVF